MSKPNAADRIAFKDSLSEGREVVHLAGEVGADTVSGTIRHVQRCALCTAELVAAPLDSSTPFYVEGVNVVTYSGTTWATPRKASCLDR